MFNRCLQEMHEETQALKITLAQKEASLQSFTHEKDMLQQFRKDLASQERSISDRRSSIATPPASDAAYDLLQNIVLKLDNRLETQADRFVNLESRLQSAVTSTRSTDDDRKVTISFLFYSA